MGNIEKMDGKTAKRRRFRGLKITVGAIVGIWALVLVIMQIVLNSSFLMKTAYKYIPQYIDADVHIGHISASVLKSFPNLNIEISDLTVTYPHNRFAKFDSTGAEGLLRHAGRAESADTLAAIRKTSLSINYLSALIGKIHIREASMDKPHIFAHCFGGDIANWDIVKTSSEAKEDSPEDTLSTLPLPPITVNKVCLTGNPAIVYTNCADTIFAAILLKQMHFHGKLTTASASANRLGLEVDSLFVSGRLPADTIAMSIDRFRIKEKDKVMAVDAEAKAFLGMNEYGRIILPISLNGHLSFPKEDVSTVSVHDFSASAASLTMTGNGIARFYGDSTYVRAEASINDCSVEGIIRDFGKNFLLEVADLKTDAKISLTALCDGYYNPSRGTLPELVAEFVMPKSSISYPGIPEGSAETDINAQTDSYGKLNISLDDLCLNFGGVDFDATGNVTDVMGDDPLIDVEGLLYASLNEMMAFVPDTLGYNATGEIDGILTGKIRMSELNPYNFYKASLNGYVRSRDITFTSESDTLYAYIGSPEIGLATIANKVASGIPKGTKILALTAKVDSLYTTYGKDIKVSGSKFRAEAQNAAKIECKEHGHEHNPIIAQLSIGELFFSGADSLTAGVIDSRNTVNYSEKKRGRLTEPRLSISSTNSRIFASESVNRYGFKDAKFTASAVMSTFENKQRQKFFLDSLQRVYPGTPRDSLMSRMMRARMAGRPVPDFIKEADFRKSDIHIPLNETMAKYLKEWNINGGLNIKTGIVITPYFPVKNVLDDVRGTISNDAVHLDNFTFRPGSSDISATGALKGLRRALLGHGPLMLDLKLTSEKIDANELLTAYTAGAKFKPDSLSNSNTMGDSEYLAKVSEAHEAAEKDSSYALIVVPANLIANISLQANNVKYSDLDINWLAADMTMKERCIQLTNTLATSNMGDISFEGFYSTKSKKDIKAGFDLNLSDITADKVVQLFPAVDTILPMLTSFKGMLDCEMAATTDLDTNMNFITQSMSGIMKISGRDVVLEESPEFKKLARLLMFKNKKAGKVADMSVSGLISDNKLEVFPFVLKIDRYTLAMSGMQNFDQTFKYHVSVIKSPVPFRFGINIFGNFDNWKYRLGKAQYKSTNVPVFTSQIDTLQMNLVSSIHNIFNKGVDLAVKQNRDMKDNIDAQKVALGFNPDAPIDSLDSGEMQMLDSLQTAYDNPVDSALNARIDSLKVITAAVDSGEDDGNTSMQQFIENQFISKASREERKAARKQRREERKAARKCEISTKVKNSDELE